MSTIYSSEDGNVHYYNNKPHQTKWKISINQTTRKIIIQDNKTKENRMFDAREFTYGQKYYDSGTFNYPGYVHYAVYTLWNYSCDIANGRARIRNQKKGV